MPSHVNSSDDEWCLRWQSPFQTHTYEPLYLANGHFGGLVDLSGATMDLWSSQIGALPVASTTPAQVKLPVTLLRTQAFYANAHSRAAGMWIGASGIHCHDARYTSDAAMPHLAQVYECRQELDLRTGVACTSGTLFLGSQAALESRLAPERAVLFRTELIFLKDAPVAGFSFCADAETDILFAPEPVLQEHFALSLPAKGISRLGNAMQCRLQWEQSLHSTHAEAGQIVYELQPHGSAAYRVIIRAADATLTQFLGRPAFVARGNLFATVEVQSDLGDTHAAQRSSLLSAAALRAEQQRRWAEFWNASDVRLPPAEGLWQQRYRASLYHVAQSLGPGPTHPGGLSKPMLPYWHGCFHDTDTYFCRALLESGHDQQAALHLDYRHRTLPVARAVAQSLGRSGALYPWQTDMDGRGDTHDVPVNGAIIACEAWHQFLHRRSARALAQASDLLHDTLCNLADHLDLTTHPLRFHERPLMTFSETMVATDPTEARVALRAVAAAYLEASRRSGANEPSLADLARRILAELTLPIGADGSYAIDGREEPAYLRCPSVLLGSFPLHHLAADAALHRTFEKEIARIVYLFAWLPHQASVVASQLRRNEGPASAFALLRQADAFYKPWHAYDEWENRRTVRAANFVTAAGGFCTALHHLLLAQTADEVWTLFPGVPVEWTDLSFSNLCTRTGWKVSAVREAGSTVAVRAVPISATASDAFTLEIPQPSPQLRASPFALHAGDRDAIRLRLTPDASRVLMSKDE